ncbi:MAG: tryptophan synthase subunit alpha [Rhodospirillaceae bacterium]|jgi:tryptophan synthase alpha chain|nr:tryptophan synthase subunit alpha [Rhodospirillaceae bacterium]MBT4587740.1 tryptophan synthase subunit alpha [Rhodospirillaceae bacterium]MBT7266772.1 tryptophan synthase subunit alpha [Rhodospirillaceae bacterium]
MSAELIGSARIAKRFADLKAEGRAGLAAFITAGDPDIKTSSAILKQLPDAGADIIELGMPFSDPMADGPAVQASSQRALDNGASMIKTLDMVRIFRQGDSVTPIILMGYFNPVYVYGVEKFVADAAEAGVDGFIIVDLPPEESEMREPVENAGLSFIYLATPTTDDERLPTVVEHASGFIYYVSVTGVTGTSSAATADIETALARLRRHSDLPITVGFGIRTAEQAAEIGKHAEAIAVGSAFVNKVAENLNEDGTAKDSCADAVLDLVREISSGLT